MIAATGPAGPRGRAEAPSQKRRGIGTLRFFQLFEDSRHFSARAGPPKGGRAGPERSLRALAEGDINKGLSTGCPGLAGTGYAHFLRENPCRDGKNPQNWSIGYRRIAIREMPRIKTVRPRKMKVKALRNTALLAVIGWILLLVISTAVFPYIKVMHDNSTIVELAIGEGLLMLRYDVVYDDEVRSLANTTFLGASGYGPPTFSKFVEQWKMYLGLDCAIRWPDQHKTGRYYGVSLWLIAAVIALLTFTTRQLRELSASRRGSAEHGEGGKASPATS